MKFKAGMRIRAKKRFSQPDVPAFIHVYAKGDVATVAKVGRIEGVKGTFVEFEVDGRSVTIPDYVAVKDWEEVK